MENDKKIYGIPLHVWYGLMVAEDVDTGRNRTQHNMCDMMISLLLDELNQTDAYLEGAGLLHRGELND
jgi:hypothetical protein